MSIEIAEKLIHSFESCARKRPDGNYEAYPDPASPLGRALQREGIWSAYLLGHAEIPARLKPLSGAPWTIGWGQTGIGIVPGLVWTKQQCDRQSEIQVLSVYTTVTRMLERPATDAQLAAMVSLAYNIGPNNFSGSSVLRYFNQGLTAIAADKFLLWNKAQSRVVQGLVNRREAERKFFLGLPA